MKRYLVGGAVTLVVVVAGLAAYGCTLDDQKEEIARQNEAAENGEMGSGASGETDVFDLRVGDCVGEPPDDEEYATMDVVDCDSNDALARVSKLVTVGESTGDYPGEDYMDEQSTERCPDPEGPVLWPTAESWDAGDRTIICFDIVE